MSVDVHALNWLRESWLARRLGLNRDELRSLRHRLLTEGPDYTTVKNRVVISPEGEKKLREHLKVPPASPPPPQLLKESGDTPSEPNEKNAAPGSDGERLHTLLVWRANLPNRKIVEAYKEGTDPEMRANILRVRVKDAGRFSRFDNTGAPMKMACRHLSADFYEFAGALPRRKGRY